MARIPVLLFGAEFWDGIINWQALARAGTISATDLDLIRYVETADEAAFLIDIGIDCLQGYYFGAPTIAPPWRRPPSLANR